jgi:hypothetical protein
MHGVYDHCCRKQVEPEIGEIPVAFVAKAKGSELSEDDVKQFVAKEVIFIFLLAPFEFMHVLMLNVNIRNGIIQLKIKKQMHVFVLFYLPFD